MTALVLYPIAIALVAVGGLLTWPVARRVGERRPDRLHWEPVDTDLIRRWVPVKPRPARAALYARLAGWWASCAPRDPHTQVRLAMVGTGRRWMDGATA